MPSKKPGMISSIVIMALTTALAGACSAAPSPSEPRLAALMRASQLALGTLNLEQTDLAVDGVAGARLLPLWELLSDLGSDFSAAPEELAAVVDAIEAAMRPDQLVAIDSMELPAVEMVSASPAPGAGPDAQVVTAAMDTALGGDPGTSIGGDILMDGGVPPREFGQPRASAVSNAPSSSVMYLDVIALLRSKIPG